MPKRSSIDEPDIDQLAAAIVGRTTNADVPASLNGRIRLLLLLASSVD